MKIEIKKNLTKMNLTKENNINRVKYIVIHFFGDLGTALNVANYFASRYRGASAHYSIDEKPVAYQSVNDEDIAWHCGANNYIHPYCRNHNSIGIEMRPNKVNRNSLIDTDNDWYFSEDTINNTLELVSYLMNLYNIPMENILRHYDITGKLCPRPFVGSDTNQHYNTTGEKLWAQFKEKLQNRREVEEMDINKLTDEQVDILIERINTRLLSKKTSDYAIEASKKAVTSGLFADSNKDGLIDNPQGFIKRQDLAVVLNNAKLLEKKK